MKFELNYLNIPPLSVAFTRGLNPLGDIIGMVRGGMAGFMDISFPSHAAMITCDSGQLFITEETLGGLKENSLEIYSNSSNRIVAMYRWKGWDDPIRAGEATAYLAEIRRKMGEPQKYDFAGLFSFIPGLRKIVKQNPNRWYCSESVASIHEKWGARWITRTEIAPDDLLKQMQDSPECKCVLGYYK